MPFAAIWLYYERIPALKAERSLQLIEAVSVPHMKAEDRRQVTGQLKRIIQDQYGLPKGRRPIPAELAQRGVSVKKIGRSKTDREMPEPSLDLGEGPG